MCAVPRLTSEERRAEIIRAARRLFAEKGFHGTRTRELADAAGVSEALLYKHFPTKEALFTAMQDACSEQDIVRFERLTALDPSASTLVLLVHFLASRMIGGWNGPPEDNAIFCRLLLRSLAEDGGFARLYLAKIATKWVPVVARCVAAAAAAGEVVVGVQGADLGGWFSHHLMTMLMLYRVPCPPLADYGVSRDGLIEQAVRFSLRGLGLKEDVIERSYNPRALALLED